MKLRLIGFLKFIFAPLLYLVLILQILFAIRKAKKYILYPDKYSNAKDNALRHQKVYKLIRFFFFIKNIKVVFEGMDQLPKIPVLFLANHKSNIDALAVYKVIYENEKLPLTSFVAKIELKNHKIGYLLDLIDVVFLDRNNPRQALRCLEVDSVKILKHNRSICIFPEGHRIAGDDLGEFKSGACVPAYKAFCPIIPVTIYNSERQLFNFGLNFKGSKKTTYKQSKTITINFGSMIKAPAFINLNHQKCMELVKQEISKTYREIDQKIANKKDDRSTHNEIIGDLKRFLFKKKK